MGSSFALEPLALDQDLSRERSPGTKVRCREIGPNDAGPVIDLLARAFASARDRNFWVHAFARLSAHATPPGCPRYGYLLESEGSPVGVILLIFTAVPASEGHYVRCNVSSWYVEPAFRAYAPMLIAVALKHKQVTYFNISPVPHTHPILEAQGYKKFCSGRIVSIPAFSRRSSACRVERVRGPLHPHCDLTDFEAGLLQAHAEYGCMSLICYADGSRFPFIFQLRPKYRGLIPIVYLIYCRSLENFVRLARPLGFYLACRGIPLVLLDANGPIRGLFGRYKNDDPKYFKGPNPPPLGDLSYSERAMFGV